ncbi:TPA: MFS transporter [Candidatus Acetothermia bacterium]|nr:MFS transporter [Candidatus Acetothermia bacterium]
MAAETDASPLADADRPAPPFLGRDPGALARIRQTMRLSVVEGSFTQVFLNWTAGSVLIGYMLHVGATPFQFGLVSSVPLLAQAASPFAAWLAGLAGRRKTLTALFAAFGRGLWALAALLPEMGLPPEARAPFLVLLVAVSSLFQASAGTLWASWMGDVVPDRKRGRYFGLRSGILGVVGMLANLGAGWFLDRVGIPLNFQVVIGVAVLLAAVGIYLLFLHYEPLAASPRPSLRETLVTPWQRPNFRRFLLFSSYWHLSVFVASPFVFPYFLDQLRMTFTQVAIWSAIASTAGLVTTAQWGRVADRVGNKAVLAIGTFLTGSSLPLCWILAGVTGNLAFIWISAVFDALAWGAIGPAFFNLALASSPRENRVSYIATWSLAAGLAGFVGGVLSGPLLTLFLPLGFTWGGVHWTGYHSLFVLSGVLRMLAWLPLRRVRETNAWRTRDVFGAMWSAWRAIGFPWRQ